MSGIRMVMLAFLVIATCGNSSTQRDFAWVIVAVCAVIMITANVACALLGVEVH